MKRLISILVVAVAGVGVCAVVWFGIVNTDFGKDDYGDVEKGDVAHDKLESVRKEMGATVAIYVCRQSDELERVCGGDDLVKEIRDAEVVGAFLDVALALEESTDDAQHMVLDYYTLYLVDKSDEVIVAIDYSHHFAIRIPNWVYYMSVEKNEEIGEILGVNGEPL